MKNNEKFPYPKGSEWRKWDLHMHTKSTSGYVYDSNTSISNREQKDDEYQKVFIEHIYSIKNLGAIAITDHNKGDWLDRIIEENKKYVLKNNKEKITIFPGTEIESHDGVHLLVIFNPESQSDEVNKNYRKETWKETIEHFMTKIGITQGSNASYTTEQIMEKAEKWDAICIFAHVTSDKGFFRVSSGTTKKRIYKHRLTHIFQVPTKGITNIGQRNIVEGRDSQYCDEHGAPKSAVCITTSDAKRLRDIATNNCWIKADPTFEGLKQIIYEPEERVYIGEEPPSKLERDKIIKSITITNSNRWFEDEKIFTLNDNLISIIGGKGSGKTAILDLIAYATGSYKCYEVDKTKSKSFIKKAFRELKGLKIEVEWNDGNRDGITVSDKLEEATKEGKVRYLPQDFIDQLCSEIGKDELEEQIENVIFQKIPPENKANMIDFRSYKSTQLKVINDKKNRITKQIEEINSKIYEYKTLIDSLDSKSEEIKRIDEDIKEINEKMKKISEALEDFREQKSILDELNSSIEQKSTLEEEISRLNSKILKIDEIMNEINVFVENSKTFTDGLKVDLQKIGIPQEKIDEIKFVLYPEDLYQLIDSRKKEIEKEITNQKAKLNKVNEKVKELNRNIKLEKSKQDSIKEINDLLSALKKKRDSLNEEVIKIKEAEKRLPYLLKDRENFFIKYFELIFEEKENLKKIYSPLESFLKGSKEENERLFDFTVQFNFDIDSMTEDGYKLIDLRAEGKFRHSTPEVLKRELENLKFTLNLDEHKISESDKKSVLEFLIRVEDLFKNDGRTASSQLKEKKTELDFYNWLYYTKYYSVSYSIKFNGIELNNLSPGLKGVALLILFLELDREDKRPILIDQPEENLDNRSVYYTLVRYFKDAKKRRQVIIVTHNPNLVVNTDSEQVIVANFDGSIEKQSSRICYVSGSLENTFKLRKKHYSDDQWKSIPDLEKQGIREHVCENLEGGKEAFEKRERKYGFGH